LKRWENYDRQLLKVPGVKDVRQAEMHTAETFVLEFSSSEVKTAVEKI